MLAENDTLCEDLAFYPRGAHPVWSPQGSEPTMAYSCVKTVVCWTPVETKTERDTERCKQGYAGLVRERMGFFVKEAIRRCNICVPSTIWEDKIVLKDSKLPTRAFGQYSWRIPCSASWKVGRQQRAANPHRWARWAQDTEPERPARRRQKQSADSWASAHDWYGTGGAAEHSYSPVVIKLEPPPWPLWKQ